MSRRHERGHDREPHRLALETDRTRESVTVAVAAGESVSIEGLEDGTYALSAVADGDEVTLVGAEETRLEDGEPTLECEADAESGSEPESTDSSGAATADD